MAEINLRNTFFSSFSPVHHATMDGLEHLDTFHDVAEKFCKPAGREVNLNVQCFDDDKLIIYYTHLTHQFGVRKARLLGSRKK